MSDRHFLVNPWQSLFIRERGNIEDKARFKLSVTQFFFNPQEMAEGNIPNNATGTTLLFDYAELFILWKVFNELFGESFSDWDNLSALKDVQNWVYNLDKDNLDTEEGG